MEQKQHAHINISAPNLVNICVDWAENGELSGRVYHCYSTEPETFSNLMHLINLMDAFFDRISFPQASTKPRYFVKPDEVFRAKASKISGTGGCDSFYRQPGYIYYLCKIPSEFCLAGGGVLGRERGALSVF